MEKIDGLDGRQNRVYHAILARSPRLAATYRTALSLLATAPSGGFEATRVLMICHCMRELMTGLLVVLAKDIVPRPKPSSGALLSQLPGLLARHPTVDLNVDQDIIPVPKTVANALGNVVATAAREHGRNRMNTAALVTGGKDKDHPAVNQWMDTYESFVGWAHLDRNFEQGRDLPNDEALRAWILVVEDVIEVRTTEFFENVRAIEDLLREINQPVEGEG